MLISKKIHMNSQTMLNTSIRLLLIILLATPMFTTGCKSKKKLAEQQALEAAQREKEAKIAEAKVILENLLNSPAAASMAELREKEEDLNYVKNMNLDDGEIRLLISQVESKLREERIALETQAQQPTTPEPASEGISSSQLNMEFQNLASTSDVDYANQQINEMLKYFSSDNTPVLIVINESGGIKDYDEPTTIIKYLNYLKDTQRSMDVVSNVEYDSNGKITELELSRRY